LNLLLSINRNYILFFALFISIVFIIIIFSKYFSISFSNIKINNNVISNVDITEPRFSINSLNQKILVTAKEGNFVDKDKILLKKNVLFKSNKFSIESDNVIFDRKKQTARSENSSTFKSKKTKISAEGFNIYDKGKKIEFYGNSKITLK
tara:strand:+ start:229 stop:678 length:450 start_codon:yes stop_codon:yes gene_type:complete